MVSILENVDLKPFNTFGLSVVARYFAEIKTISDYRDLIKEPIYHRVPRMILGGGSNVLFLKDFDGLIIKNSLKGIEILSENEKEVWVKAAAGEVWHDFVQFCITRGFGGIENLSLIPGCVGASPMQNIGAYGVEIKDVFESLEALSMEDGVFRVFSLTDCRFGYRDSIFKQEAKERFLIASCTFRLSKNSKVNTSYGAINSELKDMGVVDPGIKEVSEAVIRIRKSKLPDPAVTGNAGSFFKNPEVDILTYSRLRAQFPEIVAYQLDTGHYKLAAGWLIEQCGLKGKRVGGAMVHTRQALVLINAENASGQNIWDLSELVLNEVEKKFGVRLEREVNVVA